MVGIGCCPVSRKLKLLRVVFHIEKRRRKVAQVKTVGTNEWRNVDKRTPLPREFYKSGYTDIPVYLNDSIHMYSSEDNCIWSFHFGTEKFSAIPLPDGMRAGTRVCLCVLDSCLCLNTMDKWGATAMEELNICSHNIWIMKYYGVKDSWVKQFVVFHPDQFYSLPLWYNDKEKVLVSCGYTGIRVYDVGSKTSEKVHVLGFSHVEATVFNPMFNKLQWSDEEEEEELNEVEIERAVRREQSEEEEEEEEEDDEL
ncbi:F-box protein CPR30-like [Chenopodium quinoa]|uniref:F-box protein CPR30-like n=1 Tax=Chenopodium quinoa TaxID=63459 RepID=UPI000B797ADD|nr:F-box protein CPR30-like [Chenopodium quinoa]